MYRDLFAREAARGVTYPLLAGAEPALEQDILRLGATFWSNGMVHTNGTRAIDPALPYRLFVSVWGGSALTRAWRGADTYLKSLKMAEKDRRAIINYTINAQNIDDIEPVVRDCAERGLTITFQVYSPTKDYTQYLGQAHPGDTAHKFIQSGTPDDNLVMKAADEQKALAVLCDLIDRFPDTLVFTKALAKWLFARPGFFLDVDTNAGPPADCVAGSDPSHRHLLLGAVEEDRKGCGHESVECATCRTYTSIYPSFFAKSLATASTHQEVLDFLEAHEVFDYLYNGHQIPHWSERRSWTDAAMARAPGPARVQPSKAPMARKEGVAAS